MRFLGPLTVLGLGGVLATGASAQVTAADLRDREVRVFAADSIHQGILVDVGAQRLRLAMPGGEVVDLPREEVDALHVRTIRHYAGRGALIVGIPVGLLAGLAAESWESCFFKSQCDNQFHAGHFLGGLVVGGLVGAAVGGLFGGLMRRESWNPIVLPADPATGAMRIGLQLAQP